MSVHTWGIAGPSAAILYGLGAVPFVLVVVVGLIVGSTRVKLGYHNSAQVALSFLTAVPFTWLILYIIPAVVPTIFGCWLNQAFQKFLVSGLSSVRGG